MLSIQKVTLVFLLLLTVGSLTACNTKPQSMQYIKPLQENKTSKQEPIEKKEMPKEALYVGLYTTNQVAVINLETGETVKRIPVGAKPISLLKSPDNRYVYVANSGTGDIYMINTSTGEIDSKISLGNQPVAMAINSTGEKLYVVDYYLNRVSIINLKLRSLIGFIALNTYGFEERMIPPDCCSDMFGEPLGAGRKPSAIVLDEIEGKIYVGNLGTYDVAVLDIEKEKEITAFDAALGINEMLKIGQNNIIYISAAGNDEKANDSIISINVKGGEMVNSIKIGEKPVSMALSPKGETIYVITQKDAQLSGLKVTNNEIINKVKIGGEPGDIQISEDGNKAYVTDLREGTVKVVDLNTSKIINTIGVGVTPKSLVYVRK